MFNSRFFPRSDSARLAWLANYSTQIGVFGTKVGLDAAGIKAQQDLVTAVSVVVQADEKAYADYRAAVAKSATTKDANFKTIGDVIAHIDTDPGCTDEIRAALGIVTPQLQTIAFGQLKITFTLEALPGRVVIHWKKGKLQGVNVYGQRGSETQWQLLALDLRSPYEDARPLAQAGTTEQRRYRLVGVVNDQEVTPQSDISSIAFAG